MNLNATDLVSVLKDAIELLRTKQKEAARKELRHSLIDAENICFPERQKGVAEINRLLRETKDQKAKVLQAIDALPEKDRDYARLHLSSILDELFNSKINELRKKKRTLSKSQ